MTTAAPPTARRARRSLKTWLEMIKFSHSVFALPFALIAVFAAARSLPGRSTPYPGQFVLTIVCMVAARSVAMTFNRIADVHIDARNPRTADRALPRRALGMGEAYAFLLLAFVTFAVGCLGFYGFYQNPWPMWLGGPLILYLCGYSYTKRFTKWSHFYLGSAIALSPLAAWIAIHPASAALPAILLVGAVTLWIGGFDIIYACQDIDFDRREGLFSLPAKWGPQRALMIARICHGGTIVLLIAFGAVAELGWLYLVGVAFMAVSLGLENALVKPGDYSKVPFVFMMANGAGSLILGTAAIADILLSLSGVW